MRQYDFTQLNKAPTYTTGEQVWLGGHELTNGPELIRVEGLGESSREFSTYQEADDAFRVPREVLLGTQTGMGHAKLLFLVSPKHRAELMRNVRQTDQILKFSSLDPWYLKVSWEKTEVANGFVLPETGNEIISVSFRISPNMMMKDFKFTFTGTGTFQGVTDFPIIPKIITYTATEAVGKVRITNSTTGAYIGVDLGSSSFSSMTFYPQALWGAYTGSINRSQYIEVASSLEDFYIKNGDRLVASPAGNVTIAGQEVRYL